ncbi:28931_t:CDS:2, partial [Racocetra persica]
YASYVKSNNSNVKLWVGFCGYRDHYNCNDRLQNFDFTNSLEKFKMYITNKVKAISNYDEPEDVLGGLNAAITEMTWSNATRVIIHIGDAPPHGRRFTNLNDEYPDGDPNGLTAESVLKKMQLKNILYYFGKINNSTDVMLNVFREIIGSFPVFDLKTTGYNPELLVNKFCKATSTAIFSSITLTTTLRNSKSIYSLQRKKLQINPHEPDWTTHPEKTGKLLCYIPPKTLAEVKDYFIKSSFIEQDISFKLAPQPFSIEFNIATERAEKYIDNTKFKKFNANNGLITEFRSILEAFAHFTYKYSEVVYDLQGVDLHNEFMLTDPTIHCVDLLKFGKTNLGKNGIKICFLAKHKCNDICRKLKL